MTTKGVNAFTTHSFVCIIFCAIGLSSGFAGLLNHLSCVGLDFCSRFKFCIIIFLVTMVSFCWTASATQSLSCCTQPWSDSGTLLSLLLAHSHCKHLSDSVLSSGDRWGMSTGVVKATLKLSEHRVDGTTLNTTAAARRRRNGWRRPTAAVLASVWLLGGRTQPRCSEGSSSASPSGRFSSAASRCPGFRTRFCSRRHLDTTRAGRFYLVYS